MGFKLLERAYDSLVHGNMDFKYVVAPNGQTYRGSSELFSLPNLTDAELDA